MFWIKQAWTSLQTVILVCCKASAGIRALKAELCRRPEGEESSQGSLDVKGWPFGLLPSARSTLGSMGQGAWGPRGRSAPGVLLLVFSLALAAGIPSSGYAACSYWGIYFCLSAWKKRKKTKIKNKSMLLLCGPGCVNPQNSGLMYQWSPSDTTYNEWF